MRQAALTRPVVTFVLFFLVWLLPFLATSAEAQERSYREMRAEVVQLYTQERFAEAAEILEGALDLYPDNVMANSFNLALMRLRLGEYDRGIEALEYGLDHGIWYGDYQLLGEDWDPLKERPGWNAFEGRNAEAKAVEQAQVEGRLEVVVPDGYLPSRRYPVFIALHGGGENIDAFMPEWTSPVLREEFIVVFPQSTQLVAMNGYNWTNDIDLSLREIRDAYDEVVRTLPVDTDEVMVGGFSSGGVASLEVALKDVLPVRGFVALCPAMPENFTAEAVMAAKERGVRGTLLTTEMDGRVEEQRRMAEIMEEVGLPHEFYITPNVGHWYPDDLGERIDRAVAHIREGR